MIKIAKYLMHRNSEGNKVTPYFIANGGYFIVGEEMIGITYDDDDIYVPDTLTVLTEEELVTHVKSLTLKTPEGHTLTLEEKESLAEKWLDDNYR